jgi:hypothetical protein
MLQTEILDLLAESRQKSEIVKKHGPVLKECESIVTVLLDISISSEQVALAEEKLSGSDLIACVAAIDSMKVALSRLPSDRAHIGSGVTCRVLQNEGAILASRFQSRLRRLIQQCVNIERGRIIVLRLVKAVMRDEGTLLDTPIRFRDILQSLIAVGKGHEILQEIMMAIWQEILKPLWREKKVSAPRLYGSPESEQAEFIYESIYKEAGGAPASGDGIPL